MRDLNINGGYTKGLDPSLSGNPTTCQDVIADPRKTYLMSFNYLVDGNIASAILTVNWKGIDIMSEIVTSKTPLLFIYDILTIN